MITKLFWKQKKTNVKEQIVLNELFSTTYNLELFILINYIYIFYNNLNL